MDPFVVENPLLNLSSQYPDSVAFREGSAQSIAVREVLVRLWLTEGIPFAFRDCPAVYDKARAWLGTCLRVCPKEITLVGSARLGFSLARASYGRAFGQESDLDLTIVSESLFREVSQTFENWRSDYETKIVQPPNDRVRALWDDNSRRGIQNVRRGFIDQWMIPNLNQYGLAQKLSQTMWVLQQKLAITPGAPKPKKASVRVYASWRSLVAQVTLNLRNAAEL